MKQWIVHEEKGFLVVNKPAGILSQKDKSGVDDLATLLKHNLKLEKNSFLAPVHRLDRNTSGLLILAKAPNAAKDLTELFREGEVKKTYLAIVKGDPGASGRYDFPLKKEEKTNQTFVSEDGQEAITEFTRAQKLGNASLVEVRILTGRSHQIRAHFAAAGHALVGDKKYGKKPWSEIFTRPALHAYQLSIPACAGAPALQLECKLPEDMEQLLLRLGGKTLL